MVAFSLVRTFSSNCFAHLQKSERMSALIRIIAVCLLAAACSDGGAPTDPDKKPPITPVTTLPAGVFALDGIAPGMPHTDLEPLRAIVGNAEVVALGESTHTSGDYYRAKARLIRFLVEQMGYRVIGFESNWLEGQAATKYVASCAGSAQAAVNSLFTVWRDANVRDLFSWLCDYNRAHASDPVTFIGIDIQEPWKTSPFIKTFVEHTAPAELLRTRGLDSCLGAAATSLTEFYASQQYQNHASGNRNTGAHETCLSTITDLEAWITTNTAALTAVSTSAAVEETRLALLSQRAAEQQYWLPDPAWYEVRDEAMANMLLRLRALHTPGKKTILWAWNWHIARRYQDVRGFNADSLMRLNRQGGRSMGYFLTNQLGTGYRPIALIGYDVYTWSSSTKPPLLDLPQAVEKRLNDLKADYLLVDVRQQVGGDLLPPDRTYLVSQEWGNPYTQFDALLFLAYSAPMTFLGKPSAPLTALKGSQ
jgi:erythromycin esterase-like protein